MIVYLLGVLTGIGLSLLFGIVREITDANNGFDDGGGR